MIDCFVCGCEEEVMDLYLGASWEVWISWWYWGEVVVDGLMVDGCFRAWGAVASSWNLEL